MKRIVAVAALLVCLATPTFASVIDLSGMTTEELCELQTDIAKELASRDEENAFVLPSGTYEIGVDMVDGKFMTFPVDRDTSSIRIGDSRDSFAKLDYWVEYAREDDPYLIRLESGKWLNTSYLTLFIPADTANFPWMPKTDE